MSRSGHSGGHPSGGHPSGGHPGGSTGGRDEHGGFHRAYAEGTPPWDIGRPQPEMVALEAAGTFGPRVLDVGCGTGETALFLAERGHEVTGIDAVPAAIEAARAKAMERGLDVCFRVADVLDALPIVIGSFQSVVDVGFFHSLSDDQRVDFASKLAGVLDPGGAYAMLCFSDRVPGPWGPRRVSEAEIRATFSGPQWRVRGVRPAELHSAIAEVPVVDANLALVERT